MKRLKSGYDEDRAKEKCPFITPAGPRLLWVKIQFLLECPVFFLTLGGKAKT